MSPLPEAASWRSAMSSAIAARRDHRLHRPAHSARRHRQPGASPRARRRAQGRPRNRRPRRGHGRRHRRLRNAQYQAAHHHRRSRWPTRSAAPRNRMYCDFAFYMGGTQRQCRTICGDFEQLPGCAGIKVFMGSSTGELLVEDDEGVARILAQHPPPRRLPLRGRIPPARSARANSVAGDAVEPSRLARCRSREAVHRTPLRIAREARKAHPCSACLNRRRNAAARRQHGRGNR